MAKSTSAKKPSAKVMDGNKGTNIPIEEVTNQLPATIPQTQQQILTPEEEAKLEVAKFDLPRKWIADKKKAYSALTIVDINDKQGYKKVEAAWQEVRNKRLAVEKKHKELKAKYLVVTRAIDGEKNDLVGLLLEVENEAGAKLETIDKLAEEEKNKVEREAQQKLHTRINNLSELGMKFNGSYYVIGDTISIDAVILKTMVDEDYNKLTANVTRVAQEIRDAELKKLAEEQAEKDRIEQQKIENETKQKELLEQQRVLDDQKREMQLQQEKMLQMRTDSRSQSLTALGMGYDYNKKTFSFAVKTEDVKICFVSLEAVQTKGMEDWDILFKTTSDQIEQFKMDFSKWFDDKKSKDDEARVAKEKEEAVELAKKQRFNLRVARLVSDFGMEKKVGVGPLWQTAYVRNFDFDHIDGLAIDVNYILNATDAEWIDEIDRVQSLVLHRENQEKIAYTKQVEEQEANRVAALSDIDKVQEYLQKFALINEGRKLVLNNADIQTLVTKFDNEVAFLIEELEGELTAFTNQA